MNWQLFFASLKSHPLAFLVGTLLIVPSWITAIRQREAWPFSCYPMFSKRQLPESVRVYRLRLQRADGSSDWWLPHFYKLHAPVSSALSHGVAYAPPAVRARRNRALGIFRRCLEQDSSENHVVAVDVVMRKCEHGPDGGWTIADKIVRKLKSPADAR